VAAQPIPFEQLWHEYRRTGDDRLKDEVARRFTPIVVGIARRVRNEMGGNPSINDLVSAGMVGLLEAFERFDPERGVSFESFSGWRIAGAMHDDQRKFDWASGALRVKAQRLRAAYGELLEEKGTPPSDDDLAEALGISIGELAQARQQGSKPAPLFGESTELGRSQANDPALEDHRLDPARLMLAQEARGLLLDALKSLPDKQRYVMLLYYFEKLKMAQIGRVLDLSEARVSQLHKQALDTLTRRLGRRKDDFLEALGG